MDKEEVNQAILPEMEAEPMAEVPAETMAVEPNTSDGLAKVVERLAPGTDTSNLQAVLDAILPSVEKMIVFEDKVINLIENDEAAGAVIKDWIDLGNLPEAMAENYDSEELKALWEEINSDSYDERRGNYAKKVEGTKAKKTTMQSNIKNSQMGAQEFVDRQGLTDDQITEFMPFVDKVFKDFEDRNLTADNWEMLYKSFKRDADVADAEETGKVVGRNEQIVAKKKNRSDLPEMIPGTAGVISPAKPNRIRESYNTSSPLKKLNI